MGIYACIETLSLIFLAFWWSTGTFCGIL